MSAKRFVFGGLLTAAALAVSAGCEMQMTGGGDPTAGRTVFNGFCAACHAPSAKVDPGLVVNDMGMVNGAMNGLMLTDQQVADVKAFLSQP
jgi:mono/diheme cytochrome c family protein